MGETKYKILIGNIDKSTIWRVLQWWFNESNYRENGKTGQTTLGDCQKYLHKYDTGQDIN